MKDEEIEQIAKDYWNAGVAVPQWDDEEEAQRQTVFYRMKAAIEAMEKRGYRVCPPGHLLFPLSRHEAEVMNCVSERFLEGGTFAPPTPSTPGSEGKP